MARPARKEQAAPKQDVHYEHADATLLSEQPAIVPEGSENSSLPKWLGPDQWATLRSHLESRMSQLRAWRTSWWIQNWSDLSEFELPRRSIWLTQSAGGIPTPNNMTRGLEINSSIVDPTATYAIRVCTGGLVSGLAGPSRPWFKIVPAHKKSQLDAAARAWIDETEERLYTILALSNFYNAFAQQIEDVVVFGTAPVILYEDATSLINSYNPCVGEYYVANDGALRPNVLARQFLMTIAQMVDFFGVENCPADVQKLWEQKGSGMDQERIVAHFIEPNYGVADKGGSKVAGIVPGNFAWRECYWVWGSAGAGPLSIRGFVDKPFVVSRWATQSNDAYGRSPGMDVLPDVLQLQVETQRKAEAIEKGVRPPLVADMSMKNQPSSALPGHVTYVPKLGPDTGMKPMYETTIDIRPIAEDIAQIQARIKVGFYNDMFALLANIPKGEATAYEIAQRLAEKLTVVGPVIDSLLNDLKDQLKRVFGIVTRRGMIDDMPDSLKGVPLNMQFISVLALAQKAASTGGVERLAAFIGNLVQVYPEVKDLFDADQSVRVMADLLGTPQRVTRGDGEVADIRQKAAQQAAAAQKMAAAQQIANTGESAANMGQTLSQTEVGGGASALNVLMGGKPS